MATITHQKIDTIPSWDATDLANAKAGNPPAIPASATIADIVLSEDWNAAHTFVLGTDENFVTDAELLNTKLSLSSGVIAGGALSIGTPTSTFSISDGNGVIVDAYTAPNAPVVYEVSWTGLTNIAVTNIATETQTYVFLDNTGAVVQTNVEPTDAQHRDYIFLGQLAHTNFTSVTTVTSLPDIMASPVNQLRDIEKAIGIINEGNSVYANGANLALNKTAGILYMNGINFYTDNKTPSEKSYAAATGISWRYRTQDGSGSTVSAIDPNNYDLSGTITALTGQQATNQRVYLTIGGNIVIQYGQTVHASLVDAISGLSSEAFVVYPNLETASLIGIIAVERNTTSLQNTAKCRFLATSKFGEVTGSASGISVSTLQNAYNNSTTPEILTDSTRGAVTVKRGSAADTDTIYEGLNGAGSTTFSVKGDGTVTAASDINITTAGEALNVTGNFGGSSIYSGDGAVIRSSSGVPIDLRINGSGAVSTEIIKLDTQTNNSNFFTRYYVNGTVSGYLQNTGAYTLPLEFNTVGGMAFTGGRVGVGTIAPQDIFDVSANSLAGMGGRAVLTNIAAPAIGNTSALGFKVNSNFQTPTYYTAQIQSINTDTNNQNRLGFFLYNPADSGTPAGYERLSILGDNGYVGIGTTTPNAPLQISNAAEAKIRLSGGSGQNGMAFDAVNGSNEFYLYTGDPFSNGGNFGIYNVTTAAQLFTILDNGNIGIGTTNPTYKLAVDGQGFFENGLRLGSTFSLLDVETGASGLYLSGTQGAIDQVFISPTGTVGIGTASPGALGEALTVFNSSDSYINIIGNSSAQQIILGTSAGTGRGFVGSYSAIGFDFRTSNTARMTITDGGSVGIGTTTPAYKLDVNGILAMTGGVLVHRGNGDLDTTGNAYISWQDNSTGTYVERGWIGYGIGDAGVDIANNAGAVYLRPGGTRALTALGNGYVGIGTTAPAAILDVRSQINVASAGYTTGVSGEVVAIGSGSITAYQAGGTAYANLILSPSGGGNIGIGIASPIYNLHVVGTANFTSTIYGGTDGTAQGYIRLYNGSASGKEGNIYNDSTNGGIHIDTGANAYPIQLDGSKVILNPTGNVGIGLTSPTAKLHLPAGTTSANTAPLKITLGGALNTTPEAGAVEATNTHIYWTDSGGTRYQLDQQGGGGGVVNTYNETPTGLVNSSNTVYTAAANFNAGTTRVYLNGLRQALGVDYTETGADEITFTTAPTTGDNLFIDYEVA